LLASGKADGGDGGGRADEATTGGTAPTPANQHSPFPAEALRAIRRTLAEALEASTL
jgi:hypothetical protein